MPTILLLGPIGANQNEIVDFLVEEGDFTHVQFGRQETASTNDHRLYFTSPSAFLDYATLNWRKRFVTSQICSRNHLDAFIKRPWVLLIPLEQFVHDDDVNMFGPTPSEVDIREEQGLMSSSSTSTQTLHIPNGHSATHMTVNTLPPPSPELSKRFISRPPSPHKLEHTHKDPLAPLMRMCNLHIQMSRYPTTQDLRRHLRILDLPKEDRMRPGWDRYFMTLAGLASLR
ncbi:Deoxycytidine monophosphate (dCMP) deaminase [Cystobasidiomycetes sp. EMM_F5]